MALSHEIKDLEKNKFSEIEGKTAINANIVGGTINVSTSPNVEELELVDIASSTVIYFGYAPTGSSESDSVWKIKRLEIIGALIKTLYASGTTSYTNSWAARSSLTYS